jgi:hypothetical protein
VSTRDKGRLAKDIKRLAVGVRVVLGMMQCPSGSACSYLPVVGSSSRIQFWWRPRPDWNHWPGKRAEGGSGGGVDAAEGGVGGGPGFDSAGVGGEDRASDVGGHGRRR